MSDVALEAPTVTRAALELVEALERMHGRGHLSWNVRYWQCELKAALEREDTTPGGEKGA